MAKQTGATVPEQGPPEQVHQDHSPAGKLKVWRAKCDCTYKGTYVRQGEIVYVDKMDNPHFEKAESEKAGA
jgi:hypothetical protein